MVTRSSSIGYLHALELESESLSDALLYPRTAGGGHTTTLTGASRVTPFVIFGVGDEDVAWLSPVFAAADRLLGLPEDWDSHGAPQIDPEKVEFGLRILLGNLDPAGPTPAVVPTNSGSLQFEWHMAGIDLEIEVVSSGRVNVFYENHNTDSIRESTLTSDFRLLGDLLAELSASST